MNVEVRTDEWGEKSYDRSLSGRPGARWGRIDGVTVPFPVCALAQTPRSHDTSVVNSRCYAETPPDYCFIG